MKVLITNNTLAGRGGSELYVRDIATALLTRGHAPVAYSTVLGAVARELRAAKIPVVDDFRRARGDSQSHSWSTTPGVDDCFAPLSLRACNPVCSQFAQLV